MAVTETAGALESAVDGAGVEVFSTPNGGGVRVNAGAILDVLRFLRDDPDQLFNQLTDLTCIDREAADGIFEIIYVLRSLSSGRRLIVKTTVPASDPTVASACELWPAANWPEREAWDLFGVRFEGHPDLRRILMYDEFEGHPLRKSYPYNKRQPLVPERDPIVDPWPLRTPE